MSACLFNNHRLCPKLIVVSGDFDKYEHFSRWMFSYAQDFRPGGEIASVAEGYFDVSAVPKPPVSVAETVRTRLPKVPENHRQRGDRQ